MSVSCTRTVPPEAVLNRYGAEVLRLWVAAEDYRNDIRVSDEIIAREGRFFCERRQRRCTGAGSARRFASQLLKNVLQAAGHKVTCAASSR